MSEQCEPYGPEQYRPNLERVYLLLAILEDIPLKQMLDAQNHSETVAPFVDPTAWLRKGKAMSEDKAVTELLFDAQQKWLKLKRDHNDENKSRKF